MKATDLVTMKFTENLTVLPFVVAACAVGLSMILVSPAYSLACGLAAFGAVGGGEYLCRQVKAKIEASLKELEVLQRNDGHLFLKGTEKVFGVAGLEKVKTNDTMVYGVIYRHITTDTPSPFQAISGPLCPDCKKTLSYVGMVWHRPPGTIRFQYRCLCGFQKVLKQDPRSLYMEVRTHYNFPAP